MSEQKDAFVKFVATADPSAVDPVVEGTLGNPAMTLDREMYVMVTGGAGINATVIENYVTDGPVTPANALVTAAVVSGTDADNQTNEITKASVGSFGTDHPASEGSVNALLVNAMTYAQFQDGGAFDGDESPVGASLADADDYVPGTCMQVQNYLHLFDGGADTWDRARSASAGNLAAFSGVGVQVVAPPGEWAVNHTPAANTQATITRAAGAAGVRHICKSITATLIGLAASAEATVLVNLRDGATGAGTILWSTRLLVQGTVGNETGISLSGLNIVGSAATAMTLEFAAAGGANTFESVAMTGYDAS